MCNCIKASLPSSKSTSPVSTPNAIQELTVEVGGRTAHRWWSLLAPLAPFFAHWHNIRPLKHVLWSAAAIPTTGEWAGDGYPTEVRTSPAPVGWFVHGVSTWPSRVPTSWWVCRPPDKTELVRADGLLHLSDSYLRRGESGGVRRLGEWLKWRRRTCRSTLSTTSSTEG